MNSEPGPDVPAAGKSQDPSWSGLVERIRAGDTSAMEELYAVFAKGVRFYLWRQLGPQDMDDKVHDVFLIVTQSIQKGELREPDRLMGYVRTIVRRQVAAHIDTAVQSRRNQVSIAPGMTVRDRGLDPERMAIDRQNLDLAVRLLGSLPIRDREVLIRFYLKEQTPERICSEMDLTDTQFRLIKSRTKARYGELGQRRFALHSPFKRQ
jgi:RNA polymerase sigma-70 factor (ECF subfamily)